MNRVQLEAAASGAATSALSVALEGASYIELVGGFDELDQAGRIACDACRSFHRDVPLSTKQSFDGYSCREPLYSGTAAQNVEAFDVKLRDSITCRWPTAEFEVATRNYLDSVSTVASLLRSALGWLLHAHGLDDPNIVSKASSSSENNAMLRMLYYPREPSGTTGIAPHTDYEFFTLIYQSRPGIEIRVDDGDQWVRPTSNVLFLVGDALESFSAGKFSAATHRVHGVTERVSLVFFLPLDDHASIAPCVESLRFLKTRAMRRLASRKYPVRTQLEHIFAKDAAAHRRASDVRAQPRHQRKRRKNCCDDDNAENEDTHG